MGRGFFNGSAEGYDKGLRDALADRPKKAVDSVRETFAHAVRPQSYTQTFLKAYGRGYDDGKRKRNAVPEPKKHPYGKRQPAATERKKELARIRDRKPEPERERAL